MGVRQLCNLAYSTLIEGRDASQLAELKMQLAPPEQVENVRDELNAASMSALAQMPGMIMPPGVKS